MSYNWSKKLHGYIEKTPKELLTPQSIGDQLEIPPRILCQEVLYFYQYSLMELVEYDKEHEREPDRHMYTPLEYYLFGNKKPPFHRPMNTWMMSMSFKRTELADMTISGVKVPYSMTDEMEQTGFPGQRKDDRRMFLDPPRGINYVGAWILEDSQTGEMSYFYGSTGKDQEARRRIDKKYRTSLHIPGGKYVWTEYESDYRIHGFHKLYGGLIARRTAVGSFHERYYELDDSRFIFEMYNEKNELSIYFPIL